MAGTKYQINEANALTLKYDYHKDDMGFPGSLSEDQIDDDRTQASSPDEWGGNKSNRFNLGYNYKQGNLEVINNATYYGKEYKSFLWGSNSKTNTTNLSNDFKMKYNTDRNKVVLGFDILDGKTDDKISSEWANKQSIGGFISDTFSVTDKLDITGGVRQQQTKFKYSVVDEEKIDNITVYDLALNYKYSDTGSTFIIYGTDFRTPTTDEIYEATYKKWHGTTVPAHFNTDLKPQTGENFEIGVKDYIADTFISASVFHKIIKDEMYYDGTHNNNYDEDNKKNRIGVVSRKKIYEEINFNYILFISTIRD